MRKILLSVMLVLALSAGAFADVIYSTEDGSLGVLRIRDQASADLMGIQYKGSGEDTFLGAYWDGSSSRIILVNLTSGDATSSDTALIFSPSSMTTPIWSEPKTLSGVHQTRMIAGTNNGRGLYFASGSSVREFDTETFECVRSYTRKPASGDTVSPDVKSVCVTYYTVYAMAEEESAGNIVMAFDGQLRDDIEEFRKWGAPDGAYEMTCLGSGQPIVAHETGVDGLASSGFYEILSTDAPVKAVCRDGSSGFYFVEQSDEGTANLRHRDNSGIIFTLRTENVSEDCSLTYDASDGVMCAILGGKLLVYSAKDDSLIGEYGSGELGGNVRQVVSGAVRGAEKKDSGGSCNLNLSGAGILLLSLFLKRRK